MLKLPHAQLQSQFQFQGRKVSNSTGPSAHCDHVRIPGYPVHSSSSIYLLASSQVHCISLYNRTHLLPLLLVSWLLNTYSCIWSIQMLWLCLLISFLLIQLRVSTVFPVHSYHSIFFVLIYFLIHYWIYLFSCHCFISQQWDYLNPFNSTLFSGPQTLCGAHMAFTHWVGHDIYKPWKSLEKHCNSITKTLGDSEISFVVTDKNEKQIKEIFQ